MSSRAADAGDSALPNAPTSVKSANPELPAPDSSACAPPQIRMNGAPLKIATARAYGFPNLEDAYVLVLDNKDVPCSALLAGNFSLSKDEVSINVGVGPSANAQQFVGADNELAHVRTELVKKPTAAGDAIEICVRESAHLSVSMRFAAALEVSGSITGKYCGVMR